MPCSVFLGASEQSLGKAKHDQTFLERSHNRVVDPNIKKAVQQAEEALSLSAKQRKELVNCLPSDEEEGGEEDCDQTMQSDDESMSKKTNTQKRKESDENSGNGR
ncbi:hypothetical protein OS493_014528 [Desmophyllum pertusum]|uniref:Uncharacterized protein n=1 Tax=Desmophyllum pertusum TaxID=174260 RepID=A0A9X0CMG0_9CNID|nr:hypothetical protein OS493_014528 [Desmophyllum pertusum]